MDNWYNINGNSNLYSNAFPRFTKWLNKTFKDYRNSNLEKIPSRNKSIPRNNNGVSRFIFYGGFTPWTNTPISNKDGGNI